MTNQLICDKNAKKRHIYFEWPKNHDPSFDPEPSFQNKCPLFFPTINGITAYSDS